jgi:hypothetical protein
MTDDPIFKRLRRKVEIVRLDTKQRNDAVHHDMNELLTLLDMLERKYGKGVTDGDA